MVPPHFERQPQIFRPRPLMIGTEIAHYKITSKLGQGGMGAVYRATDTKLDREVECLALRGAVGRSATNTTRESPCM